MKFLMFYEAEIAAMTPFAAEALKQVMDDKVAERLIELFSSPEYAAAKQDSHPCAAVFRQFEDFMRPVVYPIKLIEDLKSTKLSGSTLSYTELLYRLDADQETLDYVINQPENIAEILNLLQNVRLNGSNIPTEYSPRRKIDYDNFHGQMVSVNASAELIAKEYNLKRNKDFLRDVGSNQRLFYVAGETRRGTGYAGIAGKRVKLAQIENGIRYQVLLRERGLPREQGRVFV
jgi:hypothetical protein